MIRDTIVRALARGVKVRVITDFQKSRDDVGIDVFFLQQKGAVVRFGGQRSYMHHKFAVIDNKSLLNGSFNWTASAIYQNQENVEMTTNSQVVASFRKHFDDLWSLFQSNPAPVPMRS